MLQTEQKNKVRYLKHQRDFIESKHTYTGLIGGYGAGKTSAGILKALYLMLLYKCPVLYLLPTSGLIRKAGYPRVRKYLKMMGVPYKLNITQGICATPYAPIYFVSYEAPEMIEAFEVGYVLVDEIDIIDMHKAEHVINTAVARCRVPLVDFNHIRVPNKIDFVCTPHGYKTLYRFFKEEYTPDKRIINAPSYSNPYNDIEYVKRMMKIYSPVQRRAYVQGEFVNLNTNLVYYSFNPIKNSSLLIPRNNASLHVGIDFNINNMSAVIGVIDNNQLHIIDEITGLKDTRAVIKELKNRYPHNRIYIYPDSSGAYQSTNSTRTDVDLLRDANFIVVAKKKNPFIRDRVAKLNRQFEEEHVKINLNVCRELVRCLTTQGRDLKGMPAKDGTDHMNDALGYLSFQMIFGEQLPFSVSGF